MSRRNSQSASENFTSWIEDRFNSIGLVDGFFDSKYALERHTGISQDFIKSISEFQALPGYYFSNRICTTSEKYTRAEYMKIMLLAGAYGSFPPVTLLQDNTMYLFSQANTMLQGTGLSLLVEQLMNHIRPIPKPNGTYEEMYNAVHFITCLRHSVLVEDYAKRGIKVTPIVTFENPCYFLPGKVRDWHDLNNVFNAEVVMCLSDIESFCVSSYVHRKKPKADFFLMDWEETDVQRLPGFRCLKTEKTCYMAFLMLHRIMQALNAVYGITLRIPIPESTRITSETLIEDIRDFYRKIRKIENYVRDF